jgi:flagellar biosynthesis/type III secretory pathway protein FliH
MTDETPKSAASAAAEQVQAIVAAAEQSAAALEAAARQDAERIRAEADRDSTRARDVAARLSERADELERRLDELVSGVREAVEGLRSDLAELRRRPAAAGSDDLDDELIAEVEAVAAKPPDVKVSEEPEGVTQPEGARVIAVKMALDGSPREVTARYLNENFELADPDGLLDEVYAKMRR